MFHYGNSIVTFWSYESLSLFLCPSHSLGAFLLLNSPWAFIWENRMYSSLGSTQKRKHTTFVFPHHYSSSFKPVPSHTEPLPAFFFFFFFLNLASWASEMLSSAGKGMCLRSWQPDFHLQIPRDGRRKPTSARWPLTCIYALTHVYLIKHACAHPVLIKFTIKTKWI